MTAIGSLCLIPAGVLAEAVPAGPDVDSVWKDLEMVFGPAEAKTSVTLWMNFADPECAWRFDPLAGILFDNRLAAGDFRLVIRDVCDGRHSLWAALAARSGGPDLYRQMASSLYMGVTDIPMNDDPNDLAAAIIQAVEHHVASRSDIMKTMSNRDLAIRLTAAAKTVPPGSLPRAFVNGEDVGTADPAALDAAISAAMGEG